MTRGVIPKVAIWELSCTLSDAFRILEVDEFIAELWKVHLKVKSEGYVQVFSQDPIMIG